MCWRGFAELVKSPERVHTYRLTPLSIWNACAVGENAESIVAALRGLSKYAVPSHVGASVRDFATRYGALQLRREAPQLVLRARDLPLPRDWLINRRSRRCCANGARPWSSWSRPPIAAG
jgi:DNA excision repair protein ERCC-3